MTQLLDTLAHFFDENDWPYDRNDDASVILTGFRGDNGAWPCLAWASQDESQLVFYSRHPTAVPEDRRTAVAELVTRINYNMLLGNFELDLDDGEVRFKTSISVRNDRLSTALVENVVLPNVLMMDRYLPSLEGVAAGDITPIEAVVEVESE